MFKEYNVIENPSARICGENMRGKVLRSKFFAIKKPIISDWLFVYFNV
jgi:hypothetical protein